MANVSTLAQTGEQYWRSSRRLVQRSRADLKIILGRSRALDVTSLTEASCRLLESTRPFSNLHYNKIRTKKDSADKLQPTGQPRVAWRLPVWLGALSRLSSDDQELKKEALQQLAAGPPKAAKRNRRGSQGHDLLQPTTYKNLAFLGDIDLSEVVMESLNSNNQESSNNFASKTNAGYAWVSGDVTRSRAGVPEKMETLEEDESDKSHVTLKTRNSLDKNSKDTTRTGRNSKMRVSGIAAWFAARGDSFRAQSRQPVVNNPKSFLDCGYLRLTSQTVLSLEELCRKQGIDPRPHRHMTTDQLLEYYNQLKLRPVTPVGQKKKVLRIWNQEK